MLDLITGRSGSGKTAYLHSFLGARAAAGEDRLILIVPEQFSFDSERAILSALGNRDAQKIRVLSFTRLSGHVFQSLDEPPAHDPGEGARILFMLQAVHAVQDQLVHYTRHTDSLPFVRQLLATEKEMTQAGIRPDQLTALPADATSPTFRRKAHDLALILPVYDTLLQARFPQSDRTGDRLGRLLDESQFFEGYTVAIDGFKSFTKEEQEILTRLLRQADHVLLSLCTEKDYAVPKDLYGPDPAIVFPSVKETLKKTLRIAREENVPVRFHTADETGITPGRRFVSPALAHLEQNFYSPLEPAYPEDTDDVVLCEAQDLYEECRYIAATAKKLIREEGYRCREIAVIVRKEEDYRRELLSAFRQYGIPVFDDSRQPLIRQPLITLCQTVLDAATSLSTDHLLSSLKTGLSPLTPEEASELENYCLLWEVRGSAWKEEFPWSPDGMERESDDSAERLARINELRRRIIGPLLTFRRRAKNASCEEIGHALYDYLESTGVPQKLKTLAESYHEDGALSLALEQDTVWDELMKILTLLAEQGPTGTVRLSDYASLFRAVLSVTDIGMIPQGLDEITVGSADRIRLSAPCAVFVAGCAEGVFPAAGSSTGLFSGNDRKILSRNDLELSLPEELRAAEERFSAYCAVSAPSARLYLSYHRVAPGGESYLPSSIFESVKALFPGQKPVDAALLPPDYYCETPQSTFLTYASLIRPETEEQKLISATLRAALEASDLEQGRLQALDAAADRKPFQIRDPEIATALFRKDMGLSASRVDVFYHCPFQYFCKFGMNARPRRKAQLDPMVSGTVVHYCLEKILKENSRETLLAMDQDARHQEVDRRLQNYLTEELGGADDKDARFRLLYRHLAIALYDVLDRLCDEMAHSDFVPVDFELGIGGEGPVPSYHVKLPDGGSLDLFGSIDRVDQYQKDGISYLRVVDYKTGGKDFVLSDVLYGLNMQMLIYLFALESGGEELYGPLAPAGILYYPAKRNPVSQSSHSRVLPKEQQEKTEKDRGNGLFLLNEDTLLAMDHDQEGHYIPIKPPYFRKKDGTPVDGLITAEQLGRLRRRIDDLLQEMGIRLHQGDIAADPVHNGRNYSHTCDYCDYGGICGWEQHAFHEIPGKLNQNDVYDLLLKNEPAPDLSGESKEVTDHAE